MFVQMRRMTIKEGYLEEVTARFRKKSDKPSILEQREGFIGRELLVSKPRRGEQEIAILIRWESEAAWKAWEKSPEHIAGHKKKIAEHGGKPPRPDYILHAEGGLYFVED